MSKPAISEAVVFRLGASEVVDEGLSAIGGLFEQKRRSAENISGERARTRVVDRMKLRNRERSDGSKKECELTRTVSCTQKMRRDIPLTARLALFIPQTIY